MTNIKRQLEKVAAFQHSSVLMLSLPFGLSHNTNFSWGPFYFSVKWNTGFSSLSSHQSYQSNDFLQLRYLSLSCCFLCAWVFMCMRASWSIAVELNNQPAGVGDGPRAPADCRAPQLLLQTDTHIHTFHSYTHSHMHPKLLYSLLKHSLLRAEALHAKCVGLFTCISAT